MAILTIQELIAKRESIKDKKKNKYDIETSVGTIVANVPDVALISEALDLKTGAEINKFIVYNCVIEPDLKSHELHEAFGVFEPVDIVNEIFSPGEVSKIADELFNLAGYNKKVTSKIHDAVKK